MGESNLMHDVPDRRSSSKHLPRGGGGQLGVVALAVGLVLVLLVGIQLGTLPWRMRRHMFRLQGALVGGLVGYVVGYLAGRVSFRPEGDSSNRQA
jgi:hypothetical protein